MGPKSITGIRIEGDSETQCHRGETMDDGARDWSDVSASQGALRTASNHQELEDVRWNSPFRAFRQSTSLPKPQFQILGLQNFKRIHFCCFKTPGLW